MTTIDPMDLDRLADHSEGQQQTKRRTRRAEPITKRTATNGVVSYEFRCDVGLRPDGSRDRRRFTFRTLAEARRELRRITSEVAAGRYVKRSDLTVNEACDEWLAGRRGIRRVTLYSYEMDLKPVRRHLGGKKLQQLTKADGDALVRWMLTEARTSPRHYRADALAGRVVALVSEHPEGIAAADLAAALPGGDVHSALSALLATGRVTRVRRGVYAPAEPATAAAAAEKRGLSPRTVRSALTTFGAVVQSYMDQGALPRNVIALVERPKDTDPDHAADAETSDGTGRTAKSWTLAEVQVFRGGGARSPAVRLLATLVLRSAPLRSARPAVERGRSRFGRAVGAARARRCRH